MHHYPFHVGDFTLATLHLSMIQDGAYRRLLDQIYVHERPLPLDIDTCCKMARCSSKAERDAVAFVLEKFFERRPEGWTQTRCEIEIANYRERVDTARENGKRGGRPRKSETGLVPTENRVGFGDGNRVGSYRKANQEPEPVTKNQVVAPQRKPGAVDNSPTAAHSKATRDRGSRLQPDWKLPDAWRAWALTARPDLDPVATGEQFADYWHSVPGAKGSKLDWAATWRNWVRQQRSATNGRYAGQANNAQAVTVPNADVERTAALLAEQARQAAKATPPPADLRARVRAKAPP